MLRGLPSSLLIALAAASLVAFGVLLWRFLLNRQEYEADLEDQERLLAEERERSRVALAEAAALARESQAKSEMLATLSRETRMHLNGIVGSADMLLEHAPDPGMREHLATLRSAAESLHHALNDMLEFADLETGKVAIERRGFDLRQALVEVIEQILPVASLKRLELVLVVGADVPARVVGDAARLRQVLLNLVANAVKFTSTGRIVLHADLPEGSGSVSPQGAMWVHFRVVDTGVPVPEDEQAAFFQPGPKAEPQSPRQFAGAGLGLAICQRIVTLMGGRVGVRNAPDGGAEFWIVLPLPADKEQPVVAQLSGKFAVVLDEVVATRVAASSLLSQVGLDHDNTDSVAKAVAHLRAAKDDGVPEVALLVDEKTVRKHGHALALELIREPKLSDLRVVVMAQDPDSPETDGFAIPVFGVLQKPVLRASEVLDVLSSGARTKSPQGGAPAAGADGKNTLHVLVVDDDEISRAVTSRLLIRLGCAVDIAPGGPAAIALARTTRFDVIFMDCQMPGMDGFASTQVIREAAGKDSPPIVALTANATADDREKCFAAGMCDFIGKPVTRLELSRVLKRWGPAAEHPGS